MPQLRAVHIYTIPKHTEEGSPDPTLPRGRGRIICEALHTKETLALQTVVRKGTVITEEDRMEPDGIPGPGNNMGKRKLGKRGMCLENSEWSVLTVDQLC